MQGCAALSAHGVSACFLLADDHEIFGEMLRTFVEKYHKVVGVVHDGRAMVDAALRLKPDVIIADIGMPMMNGLDAARALLENLPNLKFIFLTMQNDPNLAASALELGRVAFVLKHSASSELSKAIDHVLCGRSYLTPKLRATDWVENRARARQFSREMTRRQRDVVQLLAEGRPIKEIAWRLNLSEKTIEFHKHHIMTAFNLKNNAEVVLFALKRGLITVDS